LEKCDYVLLNRKCLQYEWWVLTPLKINPGHPEGQTRENQTNLVVKRGKEVPDRIRKVVIPESIDSGRNPEIEREFPDRRRKVRSWGCCRIKPNNLKLLPTLRVPGTIIRVVLQHSRVVRILTANCTYNKHNLLNTELMILESTIF